MRVLSYRRVDVIDARYEAEFMGLDQRCLGMITLMD